MKREQALKVLILEMLNENNSKGTIEYLKRRFRQTTIEIYDYEIARLVWKMNSESLITVLSGTLYHSEFQAYSKQ